MTLRGIARIISAAALLVAAMPFPRLLTAKDDRTARRPNIIFILADDLGFGDLGCYGHPWIKTPCLDRLATEGTRFTQFYVSHCICSPTRASAITGQSPSRWGIYAHLASLSANRSRRMPNWLDIGAPSMPRALQEAGYETAHFGKWHLGGGSGSVKNGKVHINDPAAPPVLAYGFDVARTTFGNSPTWLHAVPVDKPHGVYPYNDKEWLTWSSREIIDAAIEFLEGHRRRSTERPFMLNVWLKDPHTPMLPTAEMRVPYTDILEPAQTHYAMVSFADRQIGRMLDKLDSLGLRDNTLILFSSDNGAAENRGGSNGSLRAWKWYLYEGGIREPFIARWPSHIPAGRVDTTSVLSICDLTPTFCCLTGASMPRNYQSDGADMTDALLGKPYRRTKPMMWHHPTANNRCPTLAIRDGDWKLLMDPNGRRLQLYDLSTDIGEKSNIAEENPKQVKRLKALLLDWYRSLPAPGSFTPRLSDIKE